MRRSEFVRALDAEFGEQRAATLIEDLVLGALGSRTGAQALADGVPPRQIWLALCEATGVPEARRYGVGQIDGRGD